MIVSLFLFSACNKQDTELQDTKIQNELDEFKDYEKFVSFFRLTTESAKELIDFHSKLEPTGNEEYNNYVKEIVNSSPEQIIERQNKAIQKTLKDISTKTVVELDNMIKEMRKTRTENSTQTESSAQSRSSLGMTIGGSFYGMPLTGVIGSFEFFNLGGGFFSSDMLFPISPIIDGSLVAMAFWHSSSPTPVCYDGIYLTLAFQQPSSLASRSVFYWGAGGNWSGASINVPANTYNLSIVAHNGTCSSVEPSFYNFGQNTGCVGTHQVNVAAPNGTIYCN